MCMQTKEMLVLAIGSSMSMRLWTGMPIYEKREKVDGGWEIGLGVGLGLRIDTKYEAEREGKINHEKWFGW